MARQVLEQALEAFPGYHYTLANLGKLAGMEGDWKQAVVYYRQRYEVAPHPENLFDLADAMERAGDTAAAEAAFRQFEKEALLEVGGHDSANRELMAYYARNAKTAQEAWKLAERELERRRDVFTLARAAEAALANGTASEAWRLVDRVLKIGYRDADVLYLAGRVLAEQGESTRSRELFAEAAAFNPKAPSARLAMERLLGGGSTAMAGR
jgi:tetratricopeptide (TPR) repeat protein